MVGSEHAALPRWRDTVQPQTYLHRLAEGSAYSTNEARERLQGLAVLGVTFESGHVLALRHFEQTNAGPGFTALWMREPNGDWHFFSTNPPERSCAKYVLPELADQTHVHTNWTDDRTLRVDVPAISLRWYIEFAESRRTRFVSAVMRRVPASVLGTRGGSTVAGLGARMGLGADGLRFAGDVATGQIFHGIPRQVWQVSRSNAAANTFDFGPMVQRNQQEKFGDFYIPAAPLALAGVLEFSPLPAQLPAGSELAAAA
jgi:hypothetical protein